MSHTRKAVKEKFPRFPWMWCNQQTKPRMVDVSFELGDMEVLLDWRPHVLLSESLTLQDIWDDNVSDVFTRIEIRGQPPPVTPEADVCHKIGQVAVDVNTPFSSNTFLITQDSYGQKTLESLFEELEQLLQDPRHVIKDIRLHVRLGMFGTGLLRNTTMKQTSVSASELATGFEKANSTLKTQQSDCKLIILIGYLPGIFKSSKDGNISCYSGVFAFVSSPDDPATRVVSYWTAPTWKFGMDETSTVVNFSTSERLSDFRGFVSKGGFGNDVSFGITHHVLWTAENCNTVPAASSLVCEPLQGLPSLLGPLTPSTSIYSNGEIPAIVEFVYDSAVRAQLGPSLETEMINWRRKHAGMFLCETSYSYDYVHQHILQVVPDGPLHDLLTKQGFQPDLDFETWMYMPSMGRRAYKWVHKTCVVGDFVQGRLTYPLFIVVRLVQGAKRRRNNLEDITRMCVAEEPFEPCNHPGHPCGGSKCSCYRAKRPCEKSCLCVKDCPRRFRGCDCNPSVAHNTNGRCFGSKCVCYRLARECDPDLCGRCRIPQARQSEVGAKGASKCCGNISIQLGSTKATHVAKSDIHGKGLFARETIEKNEFIDEYAGVTIPRYITNTQHKWDVKRGQANPYLFILNQCEDVDASRVGNDTRFLNRPSRKKRANVYARKIQVDTTHRIAFFAARRIKAGEELTLAYGKHYPVGKRARWQCSDKFLRLDQLDDEFFLGRQQSIYNAR